MDIEQLIKKKIEQDLKPVLCNVINESAKHKGHAGDNGTGQTHFKLEVVSSVFEGESAIMRQRRIYSAINDLFNVGLHAVSMSLKSEKEYKK